LSQDDAAVLRALFTHHEIAAALRRFERLHKGGYWYPLRARN
jgi:hypothetical protein